MDNNFRSYNIDNCAFFNKTKEKFGELSNMCAGFSITINGYSIRTSEALYQMCRFPDNPEIQEKINMQRSPMAAKMVGKPYRHLTRSDWDSVRVNIMRWCLRVKLSQNFEKFKQVLLDTKTLPIVELSRKDSFWGAKFNKLNGKLEGYNILGRLLMELRENIFTTDKNNLLSVKPLNIDKFLIFGQPIQEIINKNISYRISSDKNIQLSLL